MSDVVFVDASCPRPYSAQSLREGALGGTEATVTRIAEALGARVMQHNRTTPEGRYLPLQPDPTARHVVLLRDPRPLQRLRRDFPNARFSLWMHDLVAPGSKRGRRLAAHAPTLSDMRVGIVCVSLFQQSGVDAVMARLPERLRVATRVIYNPVVASAGQLAAVDRDKLVFFSSPNKGLAYTLDAFQGLRRQLPSLRLCVGNPGYKARGFGSPAGVVWLGALPHHRILEEVASALCVFYPNFVLPETFGLVLAESNAVGTPVLTHDVGAAREVLADPQQVLAITRGQRRYERIHGFLPAAAWWAQRFGVFQPYVDVVREWRDGGRPCPTADSRFHLDVIAEQWRNLL